MNTPYIKRVVDDAGGPAVVAEACRLGVTAVYNWISRGFVPAEHCPTLELLCKGKHRCESMNDSVKWWVLRDSSTPSGCSPS